MYGLENSFSFHLFNLLSKYFHNLMKRMWNRNAGAAFVLIQGEEETAQCNHESVQPLVGNNFNKMSFIVFHSLFHCKSLSLSLSLTLAELLLRLLALRMKSLDMDMYLLVI